MADIRHGVCHVCKTSVESGTRKCSCTPEIQERRERGCACGPCCIVRGTKVADDAGEVGVGVDDWEGRLDGLDWHRWSMEKPGIGLTQQRSDQP